MENKNTKYLEIRDKFGDKEKINQIVRWLVSLKMIDFTGIPKVFKTNTQGKRLLRKIVRKNS